MKKESNNSNTDAGLSSLAEHGNHDPNLAKNPNYGSSTYDVLHESKHGLEHAGNEKVQEALPDGTGCTCERD